MSELIIERSIAAATMEPIGDGWTLHGRAVPYDVDQEVTDDGKSHYYERSCARCLCPGRSSPAAVGSTSWSATAGTTGSAYLGRCIAIADTSGGLDLDSWNQPGASSRRRARPGDLMGWSVSAHVFRTRKSVENGRLVMVRERCGLSHVAATALTPSTPGAGVPRGRSGSTSSSTGASLDPAARSGPGPAWPGAGPAVSDWQWPWSPCPAGPVREGRRSLHGLVDDCRPHRGPRPARRPGQHPRRPLDRPARPCRLRVPAPRREGGRAAPSGRRGAGP